MERKVGEIFEYNGEWYQCVERPNRETSNIHCELCDFLRPYFCCPEPCNVSERLDKKEVIFKKLEKVGEPFVDDGRIMQKYKDVYSPTIFTYKSLYCYNGLDGRICIEIPKNKEDMEEKKLNLKEFDLEAAKAGKPVCTRDGRKGRIISFDRKFLFKGISYPIIALVVSSTKEETIYGYNEKGKVLIEDDATYKDDLMMLPQKKDGWIIIHKEAIYDKETAEKIAKETTADVIRIQKIEWGE